MGKTVVSSNKTVKKETKTLPDGSVETTTTITTVEQYSDGSKGTRTDVEKETIKKGDPISVNVEQTVPGPSTIQHSKSIQSKTKATTKSNGGKTGSDPPSSNKGNQNAKPDEKFLDEALKAHNDYRAKHSAPPLTMDVELCNISQNWANKLAIKGNMEHSVTDLGENVYWSSQIIQDGKIPVDAWYSEVKAFNFNKMEPQKGTGHFTQLIWKSTNKMGIGRAFDKKDGTYIVANYEPAGNFVKQYSANISKASN